MGDKARKQDVLAADLTLSFGEVARQYDGVVRAGEMNKSYRNMFAECLKMKTELDEWEQHRTESFTLIRAGNGELDTDCGE